MSKDWERNNLSSVPVTIGLILGLLLISNTRARSARDIAQKTFPSVVMLVMRDSHGQPTALGSGFFVKQDIVATNLHVIEGAASGYVKIVGKKPKYDIAGFVAIDQQRDLVLLKVQGVKAPTLSLADSNDVAVGDEVYAIGNPQGLEGTFSRGIISSIRKVGEDSLLQITAPISPGSSGGPVLNAQGEVVGVSVATFKGGQNLNFAIPASYVAPLLRSSKSLRPLSTNTKSDTNQSIVRKFGNSSREGVVGTLFTWDDTYYKDGTYSFSLKNQLREPVTSVVCLLVFYDVAGQAIDVDLSVCSDTIPAGLAKRLKGRVEESVQKLNMPKKKTGNKPKVQFRILDFRILQSEALF